MTELVLLALLEYQVRICWSRKDKYRPKEFAISSKILL